MLARSPSGDPDERLRGTHPYDEVWSGGSGFLGREHGRPSVGDEQEDTTMAPGGRIGSTMAGSALMRRTRMRARVVVTAAALSATVAGACTASPRAEDQATGSSSTVSTAAAITQPGDGSDLSTVPPVVGSPDVAPCVIATGCTVPARPTSFDVVPLPDGWTIRVPGPDEMGVLVPGTVARLLTAPDGDQVRVIMLPDDASPVPPEYTDAPRSLVGGWIAYVTSTPLRNHPDDERAVSVAVRLSDRVVVLAQASKVPQDEVVAVVQALVIS
jgi:hypothetical protein